MAGGRYPQILARAQVLHYLVVGNRASRKEGALGSSLPLPHHLLPLREGDGGRSPRLEAHLATCRPQGFRQAVFSFLVSSGTHFLITGGH